MTTDLATGMNMYFSGWPDKWPSSLLSAYCEIERSLAMQVNAAILTLSEDVRLPELADEAKVFALELGGLEAEASLLEGDLSCDIKAADIVAHDLSSLHLGTSDTILMRWSEGRAALQFIRVVSET